jgi:assimilatory nitrate reductase catalytic subunit
MMGKPWLHESRKTTCAYCGVGCGIEAGVLDAAARQLDIKGDSRHPANYGRLCVKGAALGETVSLEGRLLAPRLHGQDVPWNTAISHVAQEFLRIRAEHGPDAVAFYVSGQLLTEDYYVANKLMKGYIGSANIDTNSRLCMSSSVAGHKRAFGADTVPGSYEDLEHADLVILTGSNAAWCHPVLFQRIKAAKETNPGMMVVVIDPRRTATCDIADLHLPLKPGSDVLLFNALLLQLLQRGVVDQDFVEKHTSGFAGAITAARAGAADLAVVARETGLDPLDLELFFSWFANTEKTVTCYSQGVNQSSRGTDKVNAIINCHLATGRIGRPGMGPFSLTGQPNAMGGREVGGLANQLAAHMDIENPAHRERVQRFWQAPAMPEQAGLKAVDMFEAIHAGRIKAVWIMATNPVVSLPNADRVREALEKCELVVVSDCMADTDTTRLAHVLLPAQGWAEKDGTVTNSERRISRQRALLPPPGQAQADWWIMAKVAAAMGWGEAFDFANAAAIFREHAALSTFENSEDFGLRDFDLGGLADLSDAEYEALEPVQWPVYRGSSSGRERMFASGGFFTPDRRARLIPVAAEEPANAVSPKYPLALNTGRIRDQWHTMTRTGLTAKLLTHISEPFCEIHPADATALGVEPGAVVVIRSAWGEMCARADITATQRVGSVFAPMHWTSVLSHGGRVGAVVNPATDPHSGQPESKHTPVFVLPLKAAWHGFLFTDGPVELPAAKYSVAIRGEKFWRHELADDVAPASLPALAHDLLSNMRGLSGEALEYADGTKGVYRRAIVERGRLKAVLFLATAPNLPERTWLASLFGKELSVPERRALLSGKPADPNADQGRTICSCFGVGEKTIIRAIQNDGLDSVAAIGKCLKAGTNCGSCQPELKLILERCPKAVSA